MSAGRKLQAAIHAEAAKQGMSDEARRDLQHRLTGHASTASMSPDEMRTVLGHLRGQHDRDQIPVSSAQARKLRALWVSAWHLGCLRDGSDRALAAWCRRRWKLSAARWMTPEQLSAAIEAMRAWLGRPPEDGGGGCAWAADGRDNGRVTVMLAQDRRLAALGVGWPRPGDYALLKPREQDRLIREAGAVIRRALAERQEAGT